MTTRREFLRAVVAAPFVITTSGLLMPVKKLWTPRDLEFGLLDLTFIDLSTGHSLGLGRATMMRVLKQGAILYPVKI